VLILQAEMITHGQPSLQ